MASLFNVGFTADQIVPTDNKVLIRLDAVGKETPGGIQLPDNMRDRTKVEQKIGRILAVGPGKWALALAPINDKTFSGPFRMPMTRRVGERVVFDPPYAATVRGFDDLYLVEEDAILAHINEDKVSDGQEAK